MSSPKISLEDVTIRFTERGGAGEITAVQHATLTVNEGEFVCIVGPSGCGKTTVLRAIANLQPISSGKVQVLRADAKRPATAMVFQGAAVFPWMTVLENVSYGLRTRGVPYAQQIAIAREWIARVKLERFAEAYPHQLSGGMQQRVGLARAFAYNAEVLLMDEPFGALDEFTRERMNMELLSIWARTRITIIFVTHSIPEAVFLSNRVVVMSPRPGRITQIVDIPLPYPRVFETREDPVFFQKVIEVREFLREAHEVEVE